MAGKDDIIEKDDDGTQWMQINARRHREMVRDDVKSADKIRSDVNKAKHERVRELG